MSKIIFLFVLVYASIFGLNNDKNYYQFSGYEDNNQNVHLFYSKFLAGSSNDLYHLNVSTNKEILIQSGTWVEFGDDLFLKGSTNSRILNYNTTINKLSYVLLYEDEYNSLYEIRTQIEDSTFQYQSDSFSFKNIFLTINKDTIYVSYQNNNDDSYGIVKSIDIGRSWKIQSFPNSNIIPIAISPYNSNVMFGINNDNNLLKSDDAGKTFNIVENENVWQSYSEIRFDKENRFIYALNSQALLVSDNFGDVSSWQTKFELSEVTYGNMLWYIEVDKHNSGTFYFGDDNKNIWLSNDYGENCTLFAKTPKGKFFGGIYLSPYKNELYVANKNLINVISSSENKLLRGIKPIRSLSLFPVSPGNKWLFAGMKHWDGIYSQPINGRIEIIKDTTFQNNKVYFQFDRVGDLPFESGYERVDSLGFIYKYDATFPDSEYVIEDLTLLQLAIDTLHIVNTNTQKFCNGTISQKEFFSEVRMTKVFEAINFPEFFDYDLSENLGLTRIHESWDFGYSNLYLTGAMINGMVYGDTNLVSVNEKHLNFKFELEQNYPNPFNPSTTIKYTVAKSPLLGGDGRPARPTSGGGLITLKVYDVLGREVATLVNKEQQPGNYEVKFNADNLNSGVYFYHLKADSFSQSRKMILLK
ncbi:MAG: T9SS type A sorting domain-containing protein [Bacteroidota bacterium]